MSKFTQENFGPNFAGIKAKLGYDVNLVTNGVSIKLADWCQQTCKHKWGWRFEDYAIVSFENKEEAVLFKLTYVGV